MTTEYCLRSIAEYYGVRVLSVSTETPCAYTTANPPTIEIASTKIGAMITEIWRPDHVGYHILVSIVSVSVLR
jgi:hypothetical protein